MLIACLSTLVCPTMTLPIPLMYTSHHGHSVARYLYVCSTKNETLFLSSKFKTLGDTEETVLHDDTPKRKERSTSATTYTSPCK